MSFFRADVCPNEKGWIVTELLVIISIFIARRNAVNS
jgi:hypothetical protein